LWLEGSMNSLTTASPTDELELVSALRGGDEQAFVVLVDLYQSAMLQLALAYVPSRAIAEEVVQEAWLGVLKGIGRFEGRSRLKTWIFRIVMNRAKRRGAIESRTFPFSSMQSAGEDADHLVDPDRFQGQSEPWPGHWRSAPTSWSGIPEDRLLSKEMLEHVRRAIDGLPENQREVITLRDVLGWSGVEVCNVLAITETNQRVLLHRARSRVRGAVERYLEQ
jgi:RNA polymerase sigma-70 factor (ECF subfamily)